MRRAHKRSPVPRRLDIPDDHDDDDDYDDALGSAALSPAEHQSSRSRPIPADPASQAAAPSSSPSSGIVEPKSLFYGIVHTELAELHTSLAVAAEDLTAREAAVQARAAEVETVAREVEALRESLATSLAEDSSSVGGGSGGVGAEAQHREVVKLRGALQRARRELAAIKAVQSKGKAPCEQCKAHAEGIERTAKETYVWAGGGGRGCLHLMHAFIEMVADQLWIPFKKN
jgi:hypothetical protein